MGEIYEINANEVLALLKEARHKNAAISIEGKVGTSDIKSHDAQFAKGIISSRHSRIERETITGLHEVVNYGATKQHKICLSSEDPPYELEIKYSLELDEECYSGVFGFIGLMWDVGKAIFRT